MRLRILLVSLLCLIISLTPQPLSAQTITKSASFSAVQPALTEPLKAVVSWQSTALWNATGHWNRVVAALSKPAKTTSKSTSPASSSTTRHSGSGDHTDAWWRGVAQCEQSGRNDPYYGYFSFMDGSQGGRSWDDQVDAGNALLASVGHEVGPWAAKCVTAGYAAADW